MVFVVATKIKKEKLSYLNTGLSFFISKQSIRVQVHGSSFPLLIHQRKSFGSIHFFGRIHRLYMKIDNHLTAIKGKAVISRTSWWDQVFKLKKKRNIPGCQLNLHQYSCLHCKGLAQILISASSTQLKGLEQGRPKIERGQYYVYFIKRLLLLLTIVGQEMATWKIQDA